MTSWYSLWFSFDFDGKKFCVFFLDENDWNGGSEEMARGKAKGIGAVGRRDTKDYEAAFPALPSAYPTKDTPSVASERQLAEQRSRG